LTRENIGDFLLGHFCNGDSTSWLNPHTFFGWSVGGPSTPFFSFQAANSGEIGGSVKLELKKNLSFEKTKILQKEPPTTNHITTNLQAPLLDMIFAAFQTASLDGAKSCFPPFCHFSIYKIYDLESRDNISSEIMFNLRKNETNFLVHNFWFFIINLVLVNLFTRKQLFFGFRFIHICLTV